MIQSKKLDTSVLYMDEFKGNEADPKVAKLVKVLQSEKMVLCQLWGSKIISKYYEMRN